MYFRTDEEIETSDALCMAAELSVRVHGDVRVWRWLVIALHSAVQGAMVLSLRHGNGLAALSQKSHAAWVEAYNAGAAPPVKEELDTYPGLYKKVKSVALGGNRLFTPQGSQGRSINALNRLRNEFIHFTPKGWSLEVSGLPRICLDCLALVEFQCWETNNVFWHDPEQRERAHRAVSELKKNLNAAAAIYLGSS